MVKIFYVEVLVMTRYEYRTLPNGYVVERSHHIGLTTDIYTVWVPSNYMGEYATVTSVDGMCYGDYASRRTQGIDNLPAGSPERIAAVDAWYDRLIAEAHGFIRQAYPDMNPANSYCYGPISA